MQYFTVKSYPHNILENKTDKKMGDFIKIKDKRGKDYLVDTSKIEYLKEYAEKSYTEIVFTNGSVIADGLLEDVSKKLSLKIKQ